MKTCNRTQYLTQAAVIAALYTALTLAAASLNLAFGPVQFRFSEALTILPVFTPAAIPGLTIGCLLSNIFSGYGPADMVFGTLATLLASLCTRQLRHVCIRKVPILAPVPPVLFNAAIVGAVIACASGSFLWPVFWTEAISLAISEASVCFMLGLPLSVLLSRAGIFRKLGFATMAK